MKTSRSSRHPFSQACGIFLLPILLAALLIGCGGGGGGVASESGPGPGSGPGTPDPVPPTVTGTNPADGGAEVSIQTPITVTFSETVTNVTSASFRLAAGATRISGTVTDNGAFAEFTPSAPLAAGTTYTATVTTAVRDLAGNPLATDHTWTFTTRVGGWKTPILISNGLDNASAPQVAVGRGGNGVSVWTQVDEAAWSVYANLNVPGMGWGTATLLETGGGDAVAPRVAMDENGNAVAVWSQRDGSVNNIMANRYAPETGWGTATLIEIGDGDVGSPQVAMDAAGNAVVVWSQWDGVANRIYANRHTPGAGWGTAVIIDITENGAAPGNAVSPRVVMDDNGNAVAVWSDAYSHIRSNRYAPGTGWGAATTIIGYGFDPRVAMGRYGDAVAVWTRFEDDGWIPYMSVYWCRYVPGVGWEWGTPLDAGWGDPWNARVAMNVGSNAVAVWQRSGSTARDIWASNLIGPNAATPTLIQTASVDAFSLEVAMDGSGNALAVWTQFEQTSRTVGVIRYVPGSGWGTPALIGPASGNASNPQVAMGGGGKGIVVWEQQDGSKTNIRATEYELP